MKYTRRTALKMISLGAVTVLTGKISLAQGNPLPRRSLTGMLLSDPDLSTYRDFVGIMQAKKQAEPLSWLGFASQHGSWPGGYKFCPHGDWYFLPWHRAYVLMYEAAARELTGNKSFAMPYWNWTELRTLPEAFTNPTYNGKPNPLYVPNRNTLNLSDAIVGQTQVIDKIYQEPVFEAFGTSRNPAQDSLDPSWVPRGGGYQGILERTPHNTIHNKIGAFMPTPASPRDPIFFMHHCNIDRIWASWNALGRKNSSDPLWLNMPFQDNYIRPDGTLYSATVKELQEITALGYTYDFLPQPDEKPLDPVAANRLLAVLRQSIVRDGHWQLLECTAAWEGNWTRDCFLVFAWQGTAGERLLVAVNYAPYQSQCYVRLPFLELGNGQWRLQDLIGDATYVREGTDLLARGLYLDMPPWQNSVFSLEAQPRGSTSC